jgi:hypothetical protein
MVHTAPTAPRGNELEFLTSKWRDLIDRVASLAPLAKAPLLDAKPVSVSTDHVVIGIDPEFAKNRDILANQRQIAAIQSALKSMLQRPFNVEIIVLGTSDKSLPADHPVGQPAAAQNSAAPKKTRHEWANQPEVKRALEAFNGGIVDIRE